jgi:hypothetical protein
MDKRLSLTFGVEVGHLIKKITNMFSRIELGHVNKMQLYCFYVLCSLLWYSQDEDIYKIRINQEINTEILTKMVEERL